jgi:hypothetical protein
VDTLPQKVEFPFSLINNPSAAHPGVPAAYNEIYPGWVLAHNIYMVRRNEGKYKKRNKARRSGFIFEVFRPDIIDIMRAARNALRKAGYTTEVYTDRDIAGLGKNFMTEESRKQGITAYDFFIEYYALKRLAEKVDALLANNERSELFTLYDRRTDDAVWEHVRGIIVGETYNQRSIQENLSRLMEIQEDIARNTERAKQKDDRRGRKIISDYEQANTRAEDDSFVKETWDETEAFKQHLQKLIDRCG